MYRRPMGMGGPTSEMLQMLEVLSRARFIAFRAMVEVEAGARSRASVF